MSRMHLSSLQKGNQAWWQMLLHPTAPKSEFCAPIATAGYYKPKKAPSLRPISQQRSKKGLFYYIRIQVFAA